MPATRAREHPVGRVRARGLAHRLGDPGHLALDHRERRLGRDVARREPGPAASSAPARSAPSSLSGAGAPRSRAVVGDHLAGRRSRRPSRPAKRSSRGPLSSSPLRRRPEVLIVMSAARGSSHSGVLLAAPVAAPAGLLEQHHLLDRDAALEPLDHVVDGQRGHRRRPSSPPSRRPCGRARGPRRSARPARPRRRRSRRRRRRSSAIGWASGISSPVCLAAWMPASRASPSTSPLGASPRSTARAAVAGTCARALAPARRARVASLPPTSTIRARPARRGGSGARRSLGAAPASRRAAAPATGVARDRPLPCSSRSRFQIGASRLDPVDDLARAGEGFLAVGRGDGDDHARLAQRRRCRRGARRPPRTGRGCASRPRGSPRSAPGHLDVGLVLEAADLAGDALEGHDRARAGVARPPRSRRSRLEAAAR